MHDAVNVGEDPSLHITVGLLVRKWADFMLEALSEVAVNNSKYRESLPIGFSRKDFDEEIARKQFSELMDIFASEANFQNIFELFRREFYRTRKPDLKGALAHSSTGFDFNESYRLRENIQVSLSRDSEGIVLSCGGGDLKFDSKLTDALEIILLGEPFGIGVYQGSDSAIALELIKKLLAFGLISPIHRIK